MEQFTYLKGETYEIPAVLCLPDGETQCPGVILCHGTASHKNEVGDMYAKLSSALAQRGVASVRMDFAGCGDSHASERELTFCGEVRDTETAYEYLCAQCRIDADRVGIVGFSQGGRVMAEFIHRHPSKVKAAVSWSGACQNGIGSFQDWFETYYEQAKTQGYAAMPMGWREDLMVSLEWFEDIKSTRPMDGLAAFEGPVMAFAGTADELVPWEHAKEMIAVCKNKESRAVIIEGADHVFNVLSGDTSTADRVICETADWLKNIL